MANLPAQAGNRSSVDDSKSDGPEDETTVVEPDQGNGASRYCCVEDRDEVADIVDSALSYHLPAAARCRFESSGIADFHSGASKHAGENHKVRSSGIQGGHCVRERADRF